MAHILDTLIAVGLGTIRLDQPATTLSGGEGCGLCPSCAANHAAALAAFLRVAVTLFATFLGAA